MLDRPQIFPITRKNNENYSKMKTTSRVFTVTTDHDENYPAILQIILINVKGLQAGKHCRIWREIVGQSVPAGQTVLESYSAGVPLNATV